RKATLSAKATLLGRNSTWDAAGGLLACTLVPGMALNRTEFGIRLSALGERWFAAPAPMPQGLYFPGFSAADANPDMGDSAIVETLGLGAFAMSASPAVAQFLGVGGWRSAEHTSALQSLTN